MRTSLPRSREQPTYSLADAWNGYENMLTPEWREVGIGSLRASAAGGLFGGEETWVVTMDFGTRSGKLEKAAATKATKSSTTTPGAKAIGLKTVTKKRNVQQAARTTRATKKDAQPKPIDRVLPQPAKRLDFEDGTSAAAPGANDGPDGDGVGELALPSSR